MLPCFFYGHTVRPLAPGVMSYLCIGLSSISVLGMCSWGISTTNHKLLPSTFLSLPLRYLLLSFMCMRAHPHAHVHTLTWKRQALTYMFVELKHGGFMRLPAIPLRGESSKVYYVGMS